MSSRTRRLLLSVTTVGVMTVPFVPSAGLAAQSQEATSPVPDRAEALRRQVDSLAPLYEAAAVAARAAADRRAEAERLSAMSEVDTIQVAGLTVVTPPDQVESARRIVGLAMEPFPAPGTAEALESAIISFQWSALHSSIYLEEDGHTYGQIEHRLWRSEAFVVRSAQRTIGSLLTGRIEPTAPVKEWASGLIGPPTDLSLTYRELTTQPSAASRDCMEGRPSACWLALGLDVQADDLDAWYTPDERIELVRRVLSRFSVRYAAQPEFASCTLERDVSRCDELLKDARVMNRWVAPLGTEARTAMLWIALSQGGEGALERLNENPEATPSEALRAASGLTSDELASLWRDEILAHRPVVYTGSIPVSLSSLFWVGLLGVLALRNTRWRLG